MTLVEIGSSVGGRRRRARSDGDLLDAPAVPRGDGRPMIKIVAGALPHMVDQAGELLADPSVGIFRRGPTLVRAVVLGPGAETISTRRRDAISRSDGAVILQPVDATALRDVLGLQARWIRFDERKNDWVYRDPPEDVARTLLARRGHKWVAPPLKALVRAPTLRPDGSVLAAPGYDERSHLLFVSDLKWPAIPERPTLADAKAGLDLLSTLLADLPFVEAVDMSAALALILTGLIRPVLPTAPLFAISAPAAGTGKSLAVDLAAILMTGRHAPVINGPQDPEELEKRLGAALMAGDQVIALDNLTAPLRSDFLCSALTQESVSVRVLGESKSLDLPTSTLLTATGNNLIVAGDMTRRVVMVRLDARCEFPENRSFDWNPREFALLKRPEFVAAGLTALRGFMLSGATPPMRPFGSFETWSEIVRGCLLWCGHADPLGNADSLREADPERERLALILEALQPHSVFTSASLHWLAQDDSALSSVTREFRGRGGEIDTLRFGNYLRKHRDRTVGGLTLRRANPDAKSKDVAKWRVE